MAVFLREIKNITNDQINLILMERLTRSNTLYLKKLTYNQSNQVLTRKIARKASRPNTK